MTDSNTNSTQPDGFSTEPDIQDIDAEVVESKTDDPADDDDVFGSGKPKLVNKTARTNYKWDFDKIEKYFRAGCKGPEIAAAHGVSLHTLHEAVKRHYDMPFAQARAMYLAQTQKMLRTAQIKLAVGHEYVKTEREYTYITDAATGKQKRVLSKIKETNMVVPPHPVAQIWLGKQLLGQSDAPQGLNAGFGNVPNYRLVGDDDEPSTDEDEEGGNRTLNDDEGDSEQLALPGIDTDEDE